MQEHQISFLCDGNRLLGGAVIPDEPRGLAVLLHGIPSTNPSEPGDTGYPGFAREFAERGWAAAWLDMRGARASKGYFSITGWVRDARAGLDAARTLDGLAALRTVIVGSSAGGAVAVEAARQGAPVDGLALLAAPAAWVSFAGSPADAVTRITGEAGMPLSPEVLEDPAAWAAEFETVSTEKAVIGVGLPILVLHGTADDVVPSHHAERIAERAPHAELRLIEGAGHQLRRSAEAREALFDWLRRRF